MSDNHYQDILDAQMTKLRTLTDFMPKPRYVTDKRSDIGRGNDYWIYCVPGAVTRSRLDGHDIIYAWQTELNLFVRYKTEEESTPKLVEFRGAVLSLLHAPRSIKNLNVISVLVTGDKLKQDTPPPAKPNFIIYPLISTIEQIVKR